MAGQRRDPLLQPPVRAILRALPKRGGFAQARHKQNVYMMLTRWQDPCRAMLPSPRVVPAHVRDTAAPGQALADLGVLAGRRMTEQSKRVGLLKAAGASPETVVVTMIKILAGYHVPDSGQLRIDGEQQQLPTAATALRDLGISFVHQDLGPIDSVTVTENLALRDIATRHGLFIAWRKAPRDATELLARYGLTVRGETPISQLTPFERAMVAIARALEGMTSARAAGRGLLVLDAAMAFLADHERTLLKSTARELAAAGTGATGP